MNLRQKQSKFVRMIADLIVFAYNNGYELTWGDAYVSTRTGHMLASLHYDRLAVDFNVFKDGEWLQVGEEFLDLGEYWESLDPDCSWGGRFEDGGHFSLAYGGRK